MNVTTTGVAVAVAVVIALGLLFFGPRLFSKPVQDAGLPATNQPIQAMTDTNGAPANPGQPITQTAPANVVQPADLTITDQVVGTGATAAPGDTLSMKYTGRLANGTVFDSTDAHGGTPFVFTLGAHQVIQGWDQGLVGMKVGGKRQLVIPPGMGYGAQGAGNVIPPNATLVFDVELVGIKGK